MPELRHRPSKWPKHKRPLTNHRQLSMIKGKDGKKYIVSFNPNGMIGIERYNDVTQRSEGHERMRYVDEVLQWMIESARAANKPQPPPIAQ